MSDAGIVPPRLPPGERAFSGVIHSVPQWARYVPGLDDGDCEPSPDVAKLAGWARPEATAEYQVSSGQGSRADHQCHWRAMSGKGTLPASCSTPSASS